MKKIAFVIRNFQEKSFHGGGEKLFYHLIKRFSKDDFAVDVYCSESDLPEQKGFSDLGQSKLIENSMISENRNTNLRQTYYNKQVEFVNEIHVIEEPYDHNIPETMERFYKEAKNLIKDKNYDLVISENITPPIGITFLQGHSLVNRLRKNKNPLESFLYNFRKVKKQRIKYQEKWMNEGYQRIFVVSEVLKQDIMENFGIPAEQISVVYPGVYISESIRHPELVSGSVSTQTTFGLLAPGFNIKGGFIFLKALNILRKNGYKFKAKIVYPKYSKNLGVKNLVKLYKIEDMVEFLPYQKDIGSFYNSIDCLAVPSLEDTFNIAALEAMSYKKPCIISKNAGASEIIKHKVNGFVCENNPQSLAENMMFFINNVHLHNEISEASFKTAKNYSWDKTYKNFLEELLLYKS